MSTPTSPNPTSLGRGPNVVLAALSAPDVKRAENTALSPPRITYIPLFYAALCFLAGIVFVRFQPMRPGVLLMSFLPLTCVAVLAIAKAPRLTWLPLALIWSVLGAWSAETEPSPAPNPVVTRMADGLLRTVEATVTNVGPLRRAEADSSEDTDPSAEFSAAGGLLQRVDLQLTGAEIVTDATDTVVPISPESDARIRLNIRWTVGTPTNIECGQNLRAVVRMLPPDEYHDPGVWSRTAWLQSQDITASATVDAARRDGPPGNTEPRLRLLNVPTVLSMNCRLNAWRNFATSRLQALPALTQALPRALRATPEDVAMLTALLTGDRTFLTRPLRGGFERTGSFHLIVVSGLHLSILAGLVFAMAKRLHMKRLAATAITVVVSLAYALFTGFAIPAQRSFWMITLYLIGRLLYRDRSPLNVIGFAMLCLAAASPRSIFDASLQMTVISVAAIAGIAMPLLEGTLHARIQATKRLRLISLDPGLPPTIAQFRIALRIYARHLEAATSTWIAWTLLPGLIRFTLRLGELLFVTFVVELALALPMAIYFHRITVYALPVNLVILPLLSVLVPAAMLTLLVLAVLPVGAVLPAAIALGVLHFSVFAVRAMGALAFGNLRIPEPSALQTGMAMLAFVTAVLLARWGKNLRRLALPALGLMVVFALWPRPIDHPASALLFEVIDVGQGDSLLLISPDGKTLLIDGGGIGFQAAAPGSPQAQFDTGEDVVSPVLWARGIRRLDAVALTHAHHDHMGGLPAILRNFHPRVLWVGNNPSFPDYDALLNEAAVLGVRLRPLHAGETFSLGQVEMRVLAPSAGYHPGREPRNNDSLVLRARYGATSVLLMGDAEASEEQSILKTNLVTTPESIVDSGLDLRSTVLKVGHHGSLTSTQPEFLARIAPRWAVISCGRRNRFGHPRMEVLAELQAARTRTFRTDLTGATCLLLDGTSVTAQPMCVGPGIFP